jgi:hypothetical protein
MDLISGETRSNLPKRSTDHFVCRVGHPGGRFDSANQSPDTGWNPQRDSPDRRLTVLGSLLNLEWTLRGLVTTIQFFAFETEVSLILRDVDNTSDKRCERDGWF